MGAPKAKAISWSFIDIPLTIVLKLALNIVVIIQDFFGLFLTMAANLLETILNMGKFSSAAVVVSGWALTRSLCNMFLALILLIMAVATVLQIESFGAKRLLPRLIIVALLINFSLMGAGIIVDFSNVLTNYFLTAAKGGSTISQQIMSGLNLSQTLRGVPVAGIAPPNFCTQACDSGSTCQQTGVGVGTYSCVAIDPQTNASTAISQGDEGIAQVFIGALFGVILTIIATFIVLCGAVLLIFRIVALWLLLILSPLALVAWITGTGGLWNKWLSAFFKWTFFAPIYAFFIYLAILTASTRNFIQTPGTYTQITDSKIFNSLANSPTLMLQYIAVAIMLVGGLVAAQSLGVMGAGAMLAWGKKAGKAAGKWTARKGTGYDTWAPKVMSGAGAVVAVVPGFRKYGAEMKGKAQEMKEKRLERREEQLYRKYLSTKPDSELKEDIKKYGLKGLEAAKVMNERGTLKNQDKDTVSRATELFNKFGMQKEARDITESRVDMIKDQPELESKMTTLIQEGKTNLIANEAWKDERVVAALCKLASGKQVETVRGKSKQTEDAIIKALGNLTDPAKQTEMANKGINVTDPELNKKLQHRYAEQTGDTSKMTGTIKIEWAKTAGVNDLKRLKPIDKEGNIDTVVADNIQPHVLKNALEQLDNGEIASKIAKQISENSKAASYRMREDPYIQNLAGIEKEKKEKNRAGFV